MFLRTHLTWFGYNKVKFIKFPLILALAEFDSALGNRFLIGIVHNISLGMT